MAEAIVRRSLQHVALPNLNSEADSFLSAIDGRWTDGTTTAVFDAKRLRGRVGGSDESPTSEMIVRDVSGTMIVADIGGKRYILLQRANGLAVSGGSLQAPIELHRESSEPRRR
ncbi:hypothetical protein HCU64_05080 [Methylobacterium sp. C25]|uniref:hypothetical protein n=1 Tax=Methylobacterium sp. C25 TaxID=2721622 RepID=UPI001F255FAA|nr:hypothetical protein [Methylobacterium sp. C25]MCE4223115.1 hypothetical protein [Methylobacterium sp. C25]